MDIFAHGLWAAAAGKATNLKTEKKKLNIPFMVFWGVFPDFFAFTIPFLWMFYMATVGGAEFEQFHPPGEPAQPNSFPLYGLAYSLYNISHSIPVFLVLFAVVFFIFRRPIWELSGILIHITIDIPTHSYEFFPTPFLWPISDLKIDGINWGTPWFMILNYSLIIGVYTFFYIKRRQRTTPS